jgi:hypothetical protein
MICSECFRTLVSPMAPTSLHKIINGFVAMVWLINGLLCKVLNLVPRHQQIVGSILGEDHARPFTVLIGLSEIAMALWILSGIFRRFNVVAQILIVATMNLLEFILVPDLLLWGRWNAFFALLFIFLIYFNEFIVTKKRSH